MTGRVARVHGKVLEPDHVRTVAGDQERRRPVGGRLDRERADQERGEAPLPEERGDQPERGGEDRQHDSARDDRSDQRRFCEVARPVVRQNADEAAVVACDRPVRYQHPGDEETEQDRETGDGCVGKDDADEERARRMDAAGEPRQSGGRCIPAVENGRGRTVVAGCTTARSRLRRFNSLRIHRARGHSKRCLPIGVGEVSPDRRIAKPLRMRSRVARTGAERLPTGRRGQHGVIRRRRVKPAADSTSCLFSYSSSLPWPPACRWGSLTWRYPRRSPFVRTPGPRHRREGGRDGSWPGRRSSRARAKTQPGVRDRSGAVACAPFRRRRGGGSRAARLPGANQRSAERDRQERGEVGSTATPPRSRRTR